MVTGEKSSVLRHVRRALLVGEAGDGTDADLLACFVYCHDEAAFATLVRRHGPIVLGVCRRVLQDVHDAEDAFQATFLVLVRKASSLRQRELVANWLYGVAYRTALEARSVITHRRANETQVMTMPEPTTPAEEAHHDLSALLDSELSRLPDKYRVPLLLCDLEGHSRKVVARQLSTPEGTLSSRLATARKRLAARLARRGLALSPAGLAVALAQGTALASVQTPLVVSTVNAVTSTAAGQAATTARVSAHVAALSERVLVMMLVKRLGTIMLAEAPLAVVALVLGLLAGPLLGQSSNFQQSAQGQNKGPAVSDMPEQRPAGPATGERVMALKFSPDGEWLVTAEDDGRMQLWDAKTQRPIRTLPGPSQMVRGVGFTRDSKTLAACCDDGNIYVWDVQPGRLRTTLESRPNFLHSLAFSPNGETLVSCGVTFEKGVPTENKLSIWDVAKGKVRFHIESEGCLSAGGTGLAFAPGGKHLAAAYSEGFRGVKIWDATTGQEVQRFVYETGFPLALAFSPDGKWLASGGGDTLPIQPNVQQIIGRLKVWDRTTGKLHKTLVDRSEGYFRDIVFSRDSKYLYSGS
jgi:RNA polymerase sigma factor (sigma-70 family)